MPNWKWNGARWWRFDLHTHTPASDDYGKGPSQATLKARSPKEWLLDYMKAEIECVAITDHNTGAWVDDLKEALLQLEAESPPGYRPLCLFPGVEISVYGGIHVLAILPPPKTGSDIDTLLGAAGFEGSKGRCNAVTTKSFPDVVAVIRDLGGIAIPGHVDQSSGLFKLGGTTLQQALDCKDIIAVEVVDRSLTKPTLYQDMKLNGTEILGSDSHHASGAVGQRCPGSHFTWLKMSQPCLEGLRLALLEGPLSVRRSDEYSDDPNSHGSFLIEDFEISEARYMGRSGPFTMEFNPWLNAVLGGRGTGKSTLLELLRLTLGRRKEIPQSLAKDLEKYQRPYASRDDDGLLS